MNWTTGELQVINRTSLREVTAVRQFLEQFQLSYDEQVDYTVALYRDDRIIATGSLQGEVLRNIAVDETLQGEGITAQVVSALMSEASQRGIYHYFIYTKPQKAHLFLALGFQLVACAAEHAALLESGMGTVENYCLSLAQGAATVPTQDRAALVVNCNPFTLGHQAVITKAAAENKAVIVLVVSEDRSLFPFPVRMRLIQEGLAHLPNVAVLPGGKYIVSTATFPGYFTRGEATVAAQTCLDATLFASRIAPMLGITVRYVGEEPYCAVTNAYNQALREILPQHGIAVRVMPRVEAGGQVISASRVRELIREAKWDEIRELVPDVTYRYLMSPEAEPVLNKIRESESRH